MKSKDILLLVEISNGACLNFGGGEETGIISVENGKWIIENDGDGWFTIDGKKLDKAPVRKGLYINNGRKVVVK